jgi:hypothetical protein
MELSERLVGPPVPGRLSGLVGGGVDVALRRVQILMAQQRLDLGGRRAVFGQAGGERVPQRMDQRPAGDGGAEASVAQ